MTERVAVSHIEARWEEVISDPRLQDLPYKAETNKNGQIILSPGKAWHSRFQAALVELFATHLNNGRSAVEMAVKTPEGVKVPDVIWAPDNVWEEVKKANRSIFPVMPHIVVEVMSEGNSLEEMQEKVRLYLEGTSYETGGAKEAWVVSEEGRVRHYAMDTSTGRVREREASALVPDFPARVEL